MGWFAAKSNQAEKECTLKAEIQCVLAAEREQIKREYTMKAEREWTRVRPDIQNFREIKKEEEFQDM